MRDFNALSLETVGRLTIVQGDREYLTIDAPPEMVRRITTEVRGSTLHIGYRGIFTGRNAVPVFMLGMKDVKQINAASAGNIEAGLIRADDLIVRSSSSGSIVMKDLVSRTVKILIESSGSVAIGSCEVKKVEADLESSGCLDIAGRADRVILDSSSSGTVRGEKFHTTAASVNLTSSGSAVMRVADSLDVRLSGQGNFSYFGNPVLGMKSVSGQGTIIKLDAE
ncbi:MAG: DUF2807 domain-containing protein [Spirochaetes bacterium]|nr:DUF2807 domain-containing protein [Spirochaetota bacterium]